MNLKDLTPDMREALVEALENDGRFSDRGTAACFNFPEGVVHVDFNQKLVLGPWGALVAELLKVNKRILKMNHYGDADRAIRELKAEIADFRARLEIAKKAMGPLGVPPTPEEGK